MGKHISAAKGGNANDTNSTNEYAVSQILGIKEVSELTGLPVKAIRAGIKEGLFPAFQINGCGSKYFIDYALFQTAIRNLSNRNIKQNDDTTNVVNMGGIRRIKE